LIFFRKLFRGLNVFLQFMFGLCSLVIERPRTRPDRAAWLTRFCNRLLRSAHITYSVEGPIPMRGGVVSNHLNYTDITVHSAMRPCVFVSKAELRKTPVFGWIATMSGTQYVERGAGGSAERAAQGMAKGFRDGLPIVFFPEGTTNASDQLLLPFRSGLLWQTIEANEPVTAGFLRYQLTDADVRRGKLPATDIHWGPQTLLGHIWNLLGLERIHVQVRFAPEPIQFSPQALVNRKIAAAEAREAVLALARPHQTGPEFVP
jgi:1-acyl-sn-glycerol-3-phosphate acyltransferase